MTLREWIAGTDGEKLLITDSASNAARLIRRINRAGETVSLVNVTTLMHLAKERFLRQNAEKGREVRLRTADREACIGLVERILRASPEQYPFVPVESLCRKTADEILTNLDLIRQNVTTEAFSASGDPKTEQLKRLVRAYEAELETNGLYDGPALLAAGLRAVREENSGKNGIPTAALLWEEPSALERELLQAAAPGCLLLESEETEAERIWRFFRGYGIWNEPEYVLEDVCSRGIAFGDVRIVYASPEYEAPLAAAFGARGVPIRFTDGRSAAGADPVHLMLSVLDWAENGYRYEHLKPVMMDPAFAWPEGQESYGTPAEEFLRNIGGGIGWGRDRYDAFLQRQGGSPAFRTFLRDVTGVFRLPAPVRPAELFSRLLRFAETYAAKSEQTAGILPLLRRTGNDLEYAAPSAELTEAIRLARDVLKQLRIEEAEDEGSVAAGQLSGVEVLDRPYLYVVGLADRHSAASLTESPVLNDGERRRYFDREAGRIPLACERPEEQMETYLRSLSMAEAREIHVGCCSFDTVRQEPLSPSSLYLDLREKYGNGPEDSPAVTYPGILTEDTIVRTEDLWGDGTAPEGEERTPEEIPAVTRELTFSPSALDVLLSCPAEYHFKYVRGIHEEEYDVPDENAWLNAKEKGTFFHGIVQKYVEKLFIVTDSVSSQPDGDALESAFRAAVEETERKVPVAYPAAAEREREEIREAAERFLTELHREFSDPACPWRVLACETSFGMDGREPFRTTYRFDVPDEPDGSEEPEEEQEPAVLRTDEFRVNYRGIIDRVDGYEDDGVMHYRLVDYKTGSCETFRKYKLDRTTQHHIYAGAMSLSGTVDEFVYCFPFETWQEQGKIRITEFRDPISGADVRTGFREKDRTPRELMLDELFVRNRFRADTKNGGCAFCAYADICGARLKNPEKERGEA